MQDLIKDLSKIFIFCFLTLHLQADTNNYGRLLLDGNCITCHHPTKSISAPSLEIIKQRYHEAFSEKEIFVNYMVEWVYKPTKEGSIMHNMIDKYELMPQLGYDKDTLEKIATYLYENEIHYTPPY